MLEDRIKSRMQELIYEADWLTDVPPGELVDDSRRAQCSAWLTSVQHVMHILFESSNGPYRRKIDEIFAKDMGYRLNESVEEMQAILQSLQRDMYAGLLLSITDQARAETFDNFLDHAEFYVQQGRKNEAGVISGVVFEDSLRRVCRKQNIDEKDVKLDQLISQLTSNGTFTAVKAKRARVAAHVRTKASHAQWDEFEMDDVRATLTFTHEFIASNLDS
jgi:hypothetical protein